MSVFPHSKIMDAYNRVSGQIMEFYSIHKTWPEIWMCTKEDCDILGGSVLGTVLHPTAQDAIGRADVVAKPKQSYTTECLAAYGRVWAQIRRYKKRFGDYPPHWFCDPEDVELLKNSGFQFFGVVLRKRVAPK